MTDTFLTVFFSVFSFLLGSVMASFGGVVSYRVPKHISIIRPNSKCMSCGHELRPIDNIPIFSFLLLKGKCRYCQEKIGITSFLMEILGGISYLLAFLFCKHDYLSLCFIFPIITMLQIISWEDLNDHIILNVFQIIFLFLTIGYVTYRCLPEKTMPWSFLIGSAIALLSFLLIKGIAYLIYKKDALGTGDIILISIGGLLLGCDKLLLAMLLSSLLGSCIELIRIAITKQKREIPFAPYLCFGIYVSQIFGYWIIDVFFKGVILNGILSM